VNVAVDRLFETKLKRQWTCTDCHAINSRRKADFGLHVQMPRSRKYNRPPWLLSDCVRSCSRPERVRRLCNSATCGGKKDKDRVEETIITHGPEILVIQIIRMTYNRVTGRTNKIMDWVHMNKLLDLSQHTTLRIGAPTPVAGDEFNTNKPLRYQLHGVVSHSGSTLAGGHYVATVRCRNGVDFVRVNDRVVTDFATDKEENLLEVDDGEFQSYIAVYQKVGGKMANCI
jgi:ubiquitin C-terminal hydrolase